MNITGNYRDTTATTADHGVRYIVKIPPGAASTNGLGGATIFLGIFCFILIVVTTTCIFKYNKRESEKFEKELAAKEAAAAE